jgi:protein-tyrosine phosphatase
MTKPPILESYWVEEGRFLAGEYPGGYDPNSTRLRLEVLLEAGINTFVDLTQSHELVSYENILKEMAKKHGVSTSYHRYSIRDHDVPSRETMLAILNTIDDALNIGRNVYVHCWGGVGRTGIVVGCHLVRKGYANENAITQVNKLYKTRPNNSFYPNSPESTEQIEFVLKWREE